MPKTVQSRCERCFKLYAPAELCADGADVVCVDCIDTAPVQSSEATRPTVEKGRCEKCFRLVASVALHQINDDVLCDACCVGSKRWFAIALVGAEGKIVKSIRERAKKSHCQHMLGKIVSPKIRTASTTSTSWACYTADDHLLGTVIANDFDDAVYLAQQKFEPRSQKGCYKPNHSDIFRSPLARLVRTIEFERVGGKRTKKTVYTAYSEDDTVLGRILGAKSPKHAEEIATRLYTPNDDRPKTPIHVQGYVDRVELVREGGQKKVQNRKAMKGYLLVECEQRDLILSTIKETPGVYAVLPFTEKMTFEQMERHGLPEYPTGLSPEEVQKYAVQPKEKPIAINYQNGDRVTIVTGAYAGQETEVLGVKGAHIACEVEILGNMVMKVFDVSEVRKV